MSDLVGTQNVGFLTHRLIYYLIFDILCDFGLCGGTTSASQNLLENNIMKLHAMLIGILSH